MGGIPEHGGVPYRSTACYVCGAPCCVVEKSCQWTEKRKLTRVGLPAQDGNLSGQLQQLQKEARAMGRSTGRNLRNRRRKQQIKKRLRQQSKQKRKIRPAL